jgi:cardiolipin synthase
MRMNWFASLPNFISIGRLVLAPVAIEMIVAHEWRAAFFVFIIAGVSDALDGWLAKTFQLQSELGALLDPVADKALIVSIYVALAATAVLPAWVAIMVVSRDVMIVGAVVISWLLAHPVKVRPHLASKATTVAQLVLAAVILGGEAYGLRSGALEATLYGLVAALTVASASVYLRLWVEHMRP